MSNFLTVGHFILLCIIKEGTYCDAKSDMERRSWIYRIMCCQVGYATVII